MHSLDKHIVEDMSQMEESKHYRRYITDRFEVIKIMDTEDGLCAKICDCEMNFTDHYFSGDELADGTIEVIEEGVIFHPPRADVEQFMLRGADEMSPLHSHTATKRRHRIDDMLHDEHQMSSMGDDDDKMIIIMSTEPMM
jgi:hypothetical protein